MTLRARHAQSFDPGGAALPWRRRARLPWRRLPAPAFAFKIFGLKFFEPGDEETEVVADAQPYTLEFTVAGADEELDEAIRNASSLARDEERPPPGTAGLIARAKGDYGRILAALYADGHYGGTIRHPGGRRSRWSSCSPTSRCPIPVAVSVAVDPGPLFHFGEIRIDGLPAEADDARRQEGAEPQRLGPDGGMEARSGAILDTEGRLVEVWRQRGHPKAERPTREIVADHRTNTLDVTLVVAPGPAAQLGPSRSTGTERMDPQFVHWMTGIKPGEPYDPDTLKRARDRLQRLGVFSSVAIVEAARSVPTECFRSRSGRGAQAPADRRRRLLFDDSTGRRSKPTGCTATCSATPRACASRRPSARSGREDFGNLNYNVRSDVPPAGRLHAGHGLHAAGRGQRASSSRTPMRAAASAPRPASTTTFSERLTGSMAFNVERDWDRRCLRRTRRT